MSLPTLSLVLRPNAAGSVRAHPYPPDEIKAMLARGEIEKQPGNPVTYRVKPKGTPITAPSVGENEEETETKTDPMPQVYTTRDLVAAPGQRRPRAPR